MIRAMIPLFFAAAATLAPAAFAAPEPPPARLSTLVVFGNDPCPRSSDEEIIVCARLPEDERYRIPKALRDKKKKQQETPAQSWVDRARTLDMVSRIGTPDSCSPVGTGGQTGCFRRFQELARAEREAQKAEDNQN